MPDIKIVEFDRSDAFLNEELREVMDALNAEMEDGRVVSYGICVVYEDGVDTRSWNTLEGAHDLALVGSLASLQQRLIEERNSTEEDGGEEGD